MSVRQSKIGVLLIALGSIIAVATLGVRTNQVFAAAQFYGLSFEDVDTTGTSAEYTGGSCPTSTLSNIATMPPVSRANTTDDTGSSDLGFTTVLSNCATGLSNDSVGVIDSGNVLGLSPSPWDSAEVSPHNTSNKIFGTEDIDGRITVTVQSVSCGAGASITASGSYYGRATGWETDDFLRIWVDIDGTEFDLINASTENGASSNLDVLMDTDGMEDGWRDVTTGPHTGNVATLNLSLIHI